MDYEDYNYETLKELAVTLNRPIPSLLGLSRNNDPFYCGTPAQVDKARWFAELWQRFGYGRGVHLRRMHYQIVSQDPPVLMVNGKPYENTNACWDYLGNASQAARYLDMVDPECFVDRRNGAPVDNIDYGTKHTAWNDITGSYAASIPVKLPDFPRIPDFTFFLSSPQRYHLEIWCEKSTQDDILSPLADSYKIALQYGLGELSITLAIEALRRFERSGKPVRIFYISDFDPAGITMPRSMAVKLQKYNRKLGIDLDIKLFPLVLTAEQVKQYDLPRTPIKDTDKRKDKFELRYGVGATELDALEALHPGELRSILVNEIERYYDVDLTYNLDSAWDRQERIHERTSERVCKPYEETINALRTHWEEIRERYEKEINEQQTRIASVWHAIHADLEREKPSLTADDVPQARYGDEREDALFDSSRDYLTQNEVYQAHKNGEEDIA